MPFPLRGITPAKLSIARPFTNGWIEVRSAFSDPDLVLEFQAGAAPGPFSTVSVLHSPANVFIDPATAEFTHRFYRVSARSRTAADDWKNQVLDLSDPFLSAQSDPALSDPRWIKFAILLNEPHRIYFQDSLKYLFHYDFARARFAPFRNMSRDAFNQVSLYAANQQVLLGAVIFPGQSNLPEFGIQFAGYDAYPREMVKKYFETVRSAIAPYGRARAFYMPVYEQADLARAEQAYFESHGIRLSSVERWLTTDAIYAQGWALGRLKFVTAAEIERAYAEGSLKPDDVLLTDGVPAEVPFVAGIMTLAPSTPNSHVAILARSYGVPFVFLVKESDRERARQLDGQQIWLRAVISPFDTKVTFGPVTGELDPATREALLALKVRELRFSPKAAFGNISAPADNLQPSDIQYFGGKAANFGLLRRTIPANAPRAMAFSFDLWDSFLDQQLPGGKTLRTEIDERLARHSYPPNVAALETDLEFIRDLIRNTALFAPAQKQAVIDALIGSALFDAQKNIRFRSSTNLEDSEHFTGAGLYDSYSGCLADDLD
ncbi:MAG: PEP/pyruvate-binding domain-containing protein, partial [Verrucomicrobiota bacterium]